MKYAIIETGGKQYKVEEGKTVQVEAVPGEVGQAIDFIRVLALRDGDKFQAGTPIIENASVSGKIVKNGRSSKVMVFKMKRRKGYSKHYGHRQPFTEVLIENISA